MKTLILEGVKDAEIYRLRCFLFDELPLTKLYIHHNWKYLKEIYRLKCFLFDELPLTKLYTS